MPESLRMGIGHHPKQQEPAANLGTVGAEEKNKGED